MVVVEMYKTKDALFSIFIILFLCLIAIYVDKYTVAGNPMNVAKCLEFDLKIREEDFLHLRKKEDLNNKENCFREK